MYLTSWGFAYKKIPVTYYFYLNGRIWNLDTCHPKFVNPVSFPFQNYSYYSQHPEVLLIISFASRWRRAPCEITDTSGQSFHKIIHGTEKENILLMFCNSQRSVPAPVFKQKF